MLGAGLSDSITLRASLAHAIGVPPNHEDAMNRAATRSSHVRAGLNRFSKNCSVILRMQYKRAEFRSVAKLAYTYSASCKQDCTSTRNPNHCRLVSTMWLLQLALNVDTTRNANDGRRDPALTRRRSQFATFQCKKSRGVVDWAWSAGEWRLLASASCQTSPIYKARFLLRTRFDRRSTPQNQ